MDRKIFASLLTDRLYPRLRALGYRGSGNTLRRIDGLMVEVFNVQGSSGGERCYLNLGLHMTFLPAEGGGMVAPGELSESHCAFRSRIEPPADQRFGWAYGSTMDQAQNQVERVLLEWDRQAQPFFETHSFPGGLERMLEDQPSATTHPARMLTLARGAMQLGRRELALQIAQQALERVPPMASGLRHALKQVLGGDTA